MENKKHAYLIMAHNEPELLSKLVKCLDDKRNDLYIHLDERFITISEEHLRVIPQKAKIYFIKRKTIHWAGYSIIDCELRLLKESVPTGYMYYHLISGVDLPIKKQDYIHQFFEKHNGQEFVDVIKVNTWKVESRYKYYHFEKINGLLPRTLARSLRFISSFVQALLGINKVRNEKVNNFYWGGNWFSISHNFASLILEQEQEIKKVYNHGIMVDEVFLATLLMNSKFREKLSPFGFVRLVDWRRGNPYIWTSKESDEIMSSNALFSRKFSIKKDSKVIENILKRIQ